MHIPTVLVIGLGTFGARTAVALARGGAQVIAIDMDQDLVDEVAGQVAKAACCEATDEESLADLGAFDVDIAVVAVGKHFDITVLATHMLARRGIQGVVVQVNSERQAAAVMAVGATEAVFPEADSAKRLAERLTEPNLLERFSLGRDAGIIEVHCPARFVGKSLKEIDLRSRYGVSVIAVKTPGTGSEIAVSVNPDPQMALTQAQILVVLGQNRNMAQFRQECCDVTGTYTRSRRAVML